MGCQMQLGGQSIVTLRYNWPAIGRIVLGSDRRLHEVDRMAGTLAENAHGRPQGVPPCLPRSQLVRGRHPQESGSNERDDSL
jgi:hypothetical protein